MHLGLIVSGLLLLVACHAYRVSPGSLYPELPGDRVDSPGYAAYVDRCSNCHTLTPPPLLAPSFQTIVGVYRYLYPDSADFVYAILHWAGHPTEFRSVVPGGLESFGCMPEIPYSLGEISQVAEWLWKLTEVPGFWDPLLDQTDGWASAGR